MRPSESFDIAALEEVESITVCQYALGLPPRRPGLLASRRVDGGKAEEVLTAINAATPGGSPNGPQNCGSGDSGETATASTTGRTCASSQRPPADRCSKRRPCCTRAGARSRTVAASTWRPGSPGSDRCLAHWCTMAVWRVVGTTGGAPMTAPLLRSGAPQRWFARRPRSRGCRGDGEPLARRGEINRVA